MIFFFSFLFFFTAFQPTDRRCEVLQLFKLKVETSSSYGACYLVNNTLQGEVLLPLSLLLIEARFFSFRCSEEKSHFHRLLLLLQQNLIFQYAVLWTEVACNFDLLSVKRSKTYHYPYMYIKTNNILCIYSRVQVNQ